MTSPFPAGRVAWVFFAGCLVVGSTTIGIADETPDFEQQLLPLLYHRCFSCHSQKSAEPRSGLRLDTASGIRTVIVAGQPDESELLRRVSLPHTDDDLMPPLKGGAQPFSQPELELLRAWIAQGGPLGDWTEFDPRDPAVEWNETPLSRADVPTLVRQLDELIEQANVRDGVTLNLAIDDRAFVRRVYLDVAGRIPELAESTRFLDSKAPDKRARLIDELLDSEAYVSHTFNWKADQLRLLTYGIAGQPAWLYDAWVKDSIRSGMPYDAYVRSLVTADGYLWENGATGFYLRDLGMPLEHTSNLARVFLGTRIECAQCHDHPFEPITQKDFYQLAAFTYGVSSYRLESVDQWPELSKKLDAMDASTSLRNEASRTVSLLKRRTTDTPRELTIPDTYANNPADRGALVPPRTLFGDDPAATLENRREVFADWITSPRNPRFTRNIANRLWRRVMGLGLIEPVDSLSPVDHPEHAAVLDFLTRTMVRLRFDERAYLAVLLNSRLYQSRAVRGELEPGASFPLRGPLLRRLSAEQVWDSLLGFLVPDLDERKMQKKDRGPHSLEEVTRLSQMTAEELLERSKVLMDYRAQRRRHDVQTGDRRTAIAQAKKQGDLDAVQRLEQEQDAADVVFRRLLDSLRQSGRTFPETDPRWLRLSPSLVRASEIETPVRLGHFLREFGQSDRREIDASSQSPNITHSLALMNGDLTRMATDENSHLRSQLSDFPDNEQRLNALYQAVLVRRPTALERKHCLAVIASSPTPETDILWALLNSPEFLFQQ
ncbi:DUF1549 domain-containing protein [Lignipirellula cremea]|nr:DUF1549 domain-containing protein [Lignipirellula cremea]